MGSRDGCVLTSHPGLDSIGSCYPSAKRRWRPRGLLGRLWSQRISRNRSWDRLAALQPANLPLSKLAGELLKMQFPLIFPVKLLPGSCIAVFLSLASWGLGRTVIHPRVGHRELGVLEYRCLLFHGIREGSSEIFRNQSTVAQKATGRAGCDRVFQAGLRLPCTSKAWRVPTLLLRATDTYTPC